MEPGQGGGAMDAGDGLEQGPGQPVLLIARPVGERGDRARQPAVAVGLGELDPGEAGLAGAMLDRPVAQHELGEIDVELMRRHIGAFGHEAHVAQGAGVDHRLEIGAVHRIQLAAVRLVDEVEQAGKAVTQVETATTCMTDVEHPPELVIERVGVVERRVAPIERMARRGFQAAFSHDANSKKQSGVRAGPRLYSIEMTLSPGYRGPSGIVRRGISRPWREFRTNRRFPRSLLRGRNAPCPDTYRCIRRSRRRSSP